jgi:hypothetical protein
MKQTRREQLLLGGRRPLSSDMSSHHNIASFFCSFLRDGEYAWVKGEEAQKRCEVAWHHGGK